MNIERILSAGMAVVVIAAVGLSASTLASSMSTDPADAVDVQWETLPLGEDSQGEIEAAAQSVDETYRESTGEGQRGESGDAQRRDAAPGDGSAADRQAGQGGEERERQVEQAGAGDARADSDGGQGEEGASSDGGQGDERAGRSDTAGDGALVPGGPSWFLWLAVLLAAIILAYRYRDRLREAVGGPDAPAAEPLSPAPQNDVERAWVELVERAGVDRPRTRTPRDCARRAVERGFDPGHVERLRRTFEDVRYGTAPPTDEQARRARETLASLDGERA